MSKENGSNLLGAALLCGTTGVVAGMLYGVYEGVQHAFPKTYADQPQIPTCYSEPEPYMASPIRSVNPQDLIVKTKNNLPVGWEVKPPAQIIAQATQALVKIRTPDWNGTGFVVEAADKPGVQRVITAAHVIGTATMQQLTLTTDDGRQTHPTDGCYIRETAGKAYPMKAFAPQSSEKNNGTQDIDVAVLTLPKAITASPLRLATDDPAPGSTVHMVNYQYLHGPTNGTDPSETIKGPASLNGIVTPQDSSKRAVEIVNGLQAFQYPYMVPEAVFAATHIVSGASGGPVLNADGEITAMTVASNSTDTNGNTYFDNKELKAHNVQFEGASFNTGNTMMPTTASAVPRSLIEKALSSPTLTQ
jgi:Trypsin-like peptidase domain